MRKSTKFVLPVAEESDWFKKADEVYLVEVRKVIKELYDEYENDKEPRCSGVIYYIFNKLRAQGLDDWFDPIEIVHEMRRRENARREAGGE